MWLQGLLSWARALWAPHEGHLVDRAGLTCPPLGSPGFVPKVLTVASGGGQGRAAVAKVFSPRTHSGKAVLLGVVHRQCACGLVAGPWDPRPRASQAVGREGPGMSKRGCSQNHGPGGMRPLPQFFPVSRSASRRVSPRPSQHC
uniref:Uncharacterized protein n=1 Tax=Rhinopithecus roxellana TaxID=61622 RepID=A0A2K6R3R1_RHIRO